MSKTIWYILEVLNGEIWYEDTRKYSTLEVIRSVVITPQEGSNWKYRISKVTKEVLEEVE